MVEEKMLKLFETVKKQFLENGYTIYGKEEKDKVILSGKTANSGEHIMLTLHDNYENSLRLSMRCPLGFLTIPFNAVKIEEETNSIGLYYDRERVGAFFLKHL